MDYELIDADGYSLVDADGFVADDSCSSMCCGSNGCAFYAELLPCPPPVPLPGSGPPGCVYGPPAVYACMDTLCSDRETPAFTVTTGRLYHVDQTGVCYQFNARVPASQVPPAGPLVRILPAGSTVVCFGPSPNGEPVLCSSSVCSYPGEFIEAHPCPGFRLGPNPIRIFICAALVYGCSVIDFGFRDLDGRLICWQVRPGPHVHTRDLPPGASIINTGSFGDGPVRTCCECVEGCNRITLAENECLRIEAPPPPQLPPARVCCCDGDDQYQVTLFHFTYEFVRLTQVLGIRIFNDGRLIDSGFSTPNQLAYFRWQQTDQNGTAVITQVVPTVCGFNIDSPLGLFPAPGVEFCDPFCHSCSSAGPPARRIEIITSSFVHRCNYMSFNFRFREYNDPNNDGNLVLNVEGVMQISMRRLPNPNTRCSGGCEKVDAPFGVPGTPGEPGDIGGAPDTTGDPRGLILTV